MKSRNNTSGVELAALDAYLFNNDIYPIHQTLMKKLRVTFINKSKEPVLANLVKLKASTRTRKMVNACPNNS